MEDKVYRVKKKDLNNIADAIRYKYNNNDKHTVEEMAEAIRGITAPIPEGYIKPEGILEITEGGEHDVTPYAKVVVDGITERAVLKFERDTNEGVLPDFYDWVSDKLYINTNASIEEVKEYIKSIYENSGESTFSLCGATDLETGDNVVCFDLYVDSERDIYIINEFVNNTPIYVNRELSEDETTP
jgi:hypothetical protein